MLEDISSVGMDELMEYHARYYVPANVSLVALGRLAPDEVFSLVGESILAKGRPGTRFKLPEAPDEIPAALETKVSVDLSSFSGDAKKKALCFFCSTLLPAAIKPGRLSIFERLVQTALDEEIREKRQWTYGVKYYSFFQGLFEKVEIGFLDLPFEVKDSIEAVLNNVGSSIATDEKSFERIRDRSVKRLEVMDVSMHDMADNCVEDLIRCGRIVTSKEIKKNMEEMLLADVAYILGFFRPERRCTVFEAN